MKRISGYDFFYPSDEEGTIQHVALLSKNEVIVVFENSKYQIFDISQKNLVTTGELPLKFHGYLEVISRDRIFITDNWNKEGYVFNLSSKSIEHSVKGPLISSATYSEGEIWRLETQLSPDKTKIYLMEDGNGNYLLHCIDLLDGFKTKTKDVTSSNRDFVLLPMNDKVILYPNNCEKGLIEFVIVDFDKETPRNLNVQTAVTETNVFIMSACQHKEGQLVFWANNNTENSYPSCFIVSIPKDSEGDAQLIEERSLDFPFKDGTKIAHYNFYDLLHHNAKQDITIIEICDSEGIKLASINIGEGKKPSQMYYSTPLIDPQGGKVKKCFGEIIIQWSTDCKPSEHGVEFKIYRLMNLAITVIGLLENKGILKKYNEGIVKRVVEKFKDSLENK